MKLAVIISPNWKDYAQRFLADCLASLRAQTMKDFKLFLIDNETTAASFNFLKTQAPEAQIIRLEKNEGFAAANNKAMKLALEQGFDYCALINMDTVLDETCLANWCQAAAEAPEAAIQARLMMWPDMTRINSLGNLTHFLGFGFSKAYREIYEKQSSNLQEIAYPSGAAVLLPGAVLKEIGLFDAQMWMYNEDQDLGWRWWLSGRRCLVANDVVVYHKYEFSRSIAKYYWMDRNRIIAMIKNYHWLTLIAILPAFIIMEAGLILFSLRSGWFKEKLYVWSFFLSPKNWRYLWRGRQRIQAKRKVSDRLVTKFFAGRIWYQEVDDPKLRFINPIFSLYWKLVRMIMFW